MYILINIRDKVLFGCEEDVIIVWRPGSGWAFWEWLMPKNPSGEQYMELQEQGYCLNKKGR